MSTTHTPNGGEGGRQTGTRPEERDAGSVRQEASSFAERAKREAAGLSDAAKDRAREAFEEQRDSGAERVHDVARAARSAADDLERSSPELARYTREAASAVDEFSDAIRNRSLGDLVRGMDSFARREPVAFFGTALAAGFAISRFLGSSARHGDTRSYDEDRYDPRYDTSRSGAAYGASGMANESARHQDSGLGARPMSGVRSTGAGGLASGTAASASPTPASGHASGLDTTHGTAQPTHVQSPVGTPNASSSSTTRTAGSSTTGSSSFSTSGGAQPASDNLKSGPSVPVTAKPEDGTVTTSVGTGKDAEAARKAGDSSRPGTDKH